MRAERDARQLGISPPVRESELFAQSFHALSGYTDRFPQCNRRCRLRCLVLSEAVIGTPNKSLQPNRSIGESGPSAYLSENVTVDGFAHVGPSGVRTQVELRIQGEEALAGLKPRVFPDRKATGSSQPASLDNR